MIAPTPFFADRGCHIRILEEIKVLQKNNCKVDLLTYHIGRDIKGIHTIRIPPIFFWYKKLEAGPSWWKPLMDILMITQTVNLLLKNKYDIIHAHLHEGAFVGLIARSITRKKLPILFDYQGSLTGEIEAHHFIRRFKFILPIFQFIENEIDNSVDFIITSSKKAKEKLIQKNPQLAKKTLCFLDQVNINLFKPQKKDKGLLKKFRISPDDIVVGYLGLLSHYQGTNLMLKAFKILKNKIKKQKIKFLIMGYPNLKKYKNLAKKLNIEKETIFTGRVPYEKTPKYLSLVDIAVAPKLLTSESNGKLLNYMACGLPTVAFDIPVNRELLKNSGLLVKKITPSQLAASIEKLIIDLKLREKLKIKTRKTAEENYNWNKFAKNLIEVYTQLLRNEN